MEELKRPEAVNVEDYFSEFVEFAGGQVVSKLEQNLIDRPNADYIFKDAGVIAELKCFQKDLFNDPEDVPRLIDFLYDWEKRKLISQADKIKILYGQKGIPEECYLDLVRSCRKTVDRAIHKANKQIQETKKTFSLPKAKGLLFLANDGNYLVENAAFVGLIGDLMQKKYANSEIDGFVYLTVNQVSYIPNSDLDWSLWVPGYRSDNDTTLSDFVNALGSKFGDEYYTKKNGFPPSSKIITDDTEKGFDTVLGMKYLPKEVIYKKK